MNFYLSDKQSTALQRIEASGIVYLDMSNGRYFLPGGEEIAHQTVRSLVLRKYLVANYDGLFGNTQSFRVQAVDKGAMN